MKYFVAARGVSDDLAVEYAGLDVVQVVAREGFLWRRALDDFRRGLTAAGSKASMRREIGEAIATVAAG